MSQTASPTAPQTPSARREALRILDRVLHEGDSSTALLDRSRVAPGPERGLLMELVLGTLRRMLSLDAALVRVSKRPLAKIEPRLLLALRLGALQVLHLERVPDHAAVGETVRLVRSRLGPTRAGFANGVLRSLVRLRDAGDLPRPRRGLTRIVDGASLPRFLAQRWVTRHGFDATLAMAQAATSPPELTLRVMAGARERVVERLRADGFAVEAGRYLPEALRTSGAAARSSVLRDGLAIVQDEAAQLVASLVAPEPGQAVLDTCAAPGGKAIAIDDATAPRLVVAADASWNRVGRLRANLAASGRQRVFVVISDARRPGLRAGFERILVDAPCTGTGTIRRKPEIRYRVTQETLERSRERALEIALAAADLLATGGRLVYATCSLEPEENDEVITSLCAARPEFQVQSAAPLLPLAARALVGDDGVLRTHPGDLRLDGFTAFVLERRGPE